MNLSINTYLLIKCLSVFVIQKNCNMSANVDFFLFFLLNIYVARKKCPKGRPSRSCILVMNRKYLFKFCYPSKLTILNLILLGNKYDNGHITPT